MKKQAFTIISLALTALFPALLLSCQIAAGPATAQFAVVSLETQPDELIAGKMANVTARVANTGAAAGIYHAVFNVNGATDANKDIVIQAGENQTIVFPFVRDIPGDYQVSVGNVTATLRVKEKTIVQSIPDEYRKIYATLKDALDRFDAFLDSRSASNNANYPVTFGAELLPANGNRGADLLRPQTIQAVKLSLDRLQELGVQGVTIAIGYPLYSPEFPGYQEYVSFYKQVAQEVRQRGMKLDVESAVAFSNTEFSTIKVSFAGLTFEQYKNAKRQQVASIIKDLQPDYLNLGAEPDTMASLLGMKELNDPKKYTEYVNYVLNGLDRGKTRIIAGIGTWDNINFIRSLATNTTLDALDIHIYPVTGDNFSKAVAIADIAAQYKKGLVLDECWLYKVDKLSGNGVAAAPEIFRRDSFSFWQPLDQQFLAAMVKFSRLYRVEYLSPFWTNFFYGSLDYTSDLANLPYSRIAEEANRIAAQNLLLGKPSATGEFYRKLVQENR